MKFRKIDTSICRDESTYLGVVRLKEKSVDFFSYTGFRKRRNLIFKNDKGEEVIFKFSLRKNYSIGKSNFTIKCKDDFLNLYKFTRESYREKFKCEELELKFDMLLHTQHSSGFKFADYFKLSMSSMYKGYGTSLYITTASENRDLLERKGPNSYFNNYIYLSEFDTLGYTYHDVYKVAPKVHEDISSLYYNKEFGLIGFQDKYSGFWIYDRLE
jgi:hypothetical protein